METFINSIVTLSKEDFLNPKGLPEIRKILTDCNVVIVRNAVETQNIRTMVRNLLDNPPKKTEDTRVLEGVQNIFYESKGNEFQNRSDNERSKYSAFDKSFYFFPWNYDKTGISTAIQPLFDQVLRLNGFNPAEIAKRTPKDGVVQRFHLIFYPQGQGLISAHRDPIKETLFTGGVYVTEFGRDYTTGGFYVFNSKGEKVFVDHQVKSGDVVLFQANLPHGVDVNYFVESEVSQLDSSRFLGRCFINMTVVESHHVKNRETTKGIEMA